MSKTTTIPSSKEESETARQNETVAPKRAVSSQEKNAIIALLLWFFLGGFGAHHFYAGDPGKGMTMLALMIAGFLTIVFLIGIPVLIGVFIWWVMDGVKLITKLGQTQGAQ